MICSKPTCCTGRRRWATTGWNGCSANCIPRPAGPAIASSSTRPAPSGTSSRRRAAPHAQRVRLARPGSHHRPAGPASARLPRQGNRRALAASPHHSLASARAPARPDPGRPAGITRRTGVHPHPGPAARDLPPAPCPSTWPPPPRTADHPRRHRHAVLYQQTPLGTELAHGEPADPVKDGALPAAAVHDLTERPPVGRPDRRERPPGGVAERYEQGPVAVVGKAEQLAGEPHGRPRRRGSCRFRGRRPRASWPSPPGLGRTAPGGTRYPRRGR